MSNEEETNRIWNELQTVRKRLHSLESSVAAHTMILKYDAVLKTGPLMASLDKVINEVKNMQYESATRKQIEDALDAQTRQLKRTAFNKFSIREKVVAAFVGVALLVINILEVVIHAK